MTQNIKFRAFHDGEMKEVYQIQFRATGELVCYARVKGDLIKLVGAVIVQSTGLFDKNGKEIFVGDILQVDEYFNEDLEVNLKRIGLVFFQNGEGKFKEVGYFVKMMLFRNGEFWREDECELKKARWDESYNHNTQPTTGWKIVGNKFQNPELLKKNAN